MDELNEEPHTLRSFLQRLRSGDPPPEFQKWVTMTGVAAVGGFTYGALMGARRGKLDGFRRGVSPYPLMYMELVKTAPRYLFRFGGFCGLFYGIELGMRWKRRTDDILNYATAGILAGGAYRIPAGPAAVVAGSVIGVVLGVALGGVQLYSEQLAESLKEKEAQMVEPVDTEKQVAKAIAMLEARQRDLFGSKKDDN